MAGECSHKHVAQELARRVKAEVYPLPCLGWQQHVPFKPEHQHGQEVRLTALTLLAPTLYQTGCRTHKLLTCELPLRLRSFGCIPELCQPVSVGGWPRQGYFQIGGVCKQGHRQCIGGGKAQDT